jgi:hypothetical protein
MGLCKVPLQNILAKSLLNGSELKLVFLAVGGGTYCSMRARAKHLASHLMTLQGESGNIAVWINDARFEYGPVEMFLSPTPPSRQVT